MIILIRHAEKSKNDDVNLSRSGYVRRNELAQFFKNRYNKNLKDPKRFISMKQKTIDTSNRPFQTIFMLAHTFDKKIENNFEREQTKEFVDSFITDISKDSLICWEHEALCEIAQRLIKKIYNKKLKLSWGFNPLSNTDNPEDYSSIWVIDTENHYLKVYNQFDILYDPENDCYTPDYTHVSIEPLFSITLKEFGYLDTFKKWIGF